MSYEQRCTALAIALAANIPVILWGGPGVGKSSVIARIAEHHGWHLEVVIASISDPTDIKGMPREDGGRTVFSPPDWAVAVHASGGGLVFLDEMSTAPPSVQAAMLRPVLERVVGSLTLPAQTRFVAAANPPDTAADGWDLTPPLANRFLHLAWDVPAAVIADGFLYGFEPVAVPDVAPDAVATAELEARRMIGAFFGARPDLVHRMPASASDTGMAWPSPRSWEAGARAVGHARAAGAGLAVEQLLLAGCVGGSAAREFLAWRRQADLPDVEAALRADGRIDLPTAPDRLVAVCAGLVAAVLDTPDRPRCEAAVNGILVAVCDAGHVDLATVALRRIAPAVRASGAVLSPAAIAHFAGILGHMGVLARGA